MHSDDNSAGGRVPLTGAGGAAWAAEPDPEPRSTRRDGIRRARRASNWTAAALIAGTGGAAFALANHALMATTPAAAAPGTAGTAGVTGTSGTSGTSASSGPAVGQSVATTSGSGVTTTTTTRVVNGKTIITRTQHAPAYSDN